MLKIYEYNETDFSTNGICILAEEVDNQDISAFNVKVSREINGDWQLIFDYPLIGEKVYEIKPNRIILCEGQRYRIIRIEPQNGATKSVAVTCLHIYRDNEKRHIQYYPLQINTTPHDAMVAAFQGTPIHVMTEEEVAALGLEWADTPTDIFEQSKIVPAEIVNILIQSIGYGELYIDNYNIALVKRIGVDRELRLNMERNLQSIKPLKDTTDLITRLYPYGINDLHIGSLNEGIQFIDSPNITEYGVHEAFIDYNDIEDAQELLDRAKWEFDSENEQRIDQPKITYDVNLIDLSKLPEYKDTDHIELGDTIEIYDVLTGTIQTSLTGVKDRIIKMDYYPYEPQNSTVTIGQPQKDLWYYMKSLNKGNQNYQKSLDASGQVKTHWLEMMQQNETTAINNDLKQYKIAKFDYGAIWTNEQIPCAVAIINGKLCISNRKEDGDWFWSAVMDAGKVIVGETFTGALYTDLVTILSKSGRLEIKDNLITMKDENGTLRSQFGLYNGKYTFNIFDKNGKAMITLNDNGEAIFAGSIDTLKSVKVGEHIALRNEIGMEYGRIYAGDSLLYQGEKTLQIIGKNIDIYADGDILRLRGEKQVSIGTNGGGNVFINSNNVSNAWARLDNMWRWYNAQLEIYNPQSLYAD